MNVLLTGARGQLGISILEIAFKFGVTVKTVVRKVDLHQTIEHIDAELRGERYSALIHCAADTNVERNELFPEMAVASNSLFTELIAKVACKHEVRMLYVSSTGVYGDRCRDPHSEDSECWPTTVHHRTKLVGERSVLRYNPMNLVLRTGWLFGGAKYGLNDFVVCRLREMLLADTGILFANYEQRGVPTFVDDVSRHVFKLLAMNVGGVFNVVSKSNASRLEYISLISEQLSSGVTIEPKDNFFFKRVAPVSMNEMAINKRMMDLSVDEMPYWADALLHYLSSFQDQITLKARDYGNP